MSATHETQTAPPKRGGFHAGSLRWQVIIWLTFFHAMAAFALWPRLFTWSGLVICLALCWISGGLGVSLGYHRLLTHGSFKCSPWLRHTLTVLGCLTLQGNPSEWVGMHRLHHRYSDSDHDPHSPKHGFTWAHILWTLHEDAYGFRGVDAAKDLLRDPTFRLIDKYFWLPQVLMIFILFTLGRVLGDRTTAVSWVIWGVGVRTVLVFHLTWFVNSAAHTWGYRNYESGEGSTNLWWVALIGFGEGWHNNHHKYPRSAAHGLRWFEFDSTWCVIRVLEKLGLVWDVKRLKPEQMPRKNV